MDNDDNITILPEIAEVKELGRLRDTDSNGPLEETQLRLIYSDQSGESFQVLMTLKVAVQLRDLLDQIA